MENCKLNVILFFCICCFSCKKSTNSSITTYQSAATVMGLQFERPYYLKLDWSGLMYADTVWFHSNNTITEAGFYNTTYYYHNTYPAYLNAVANNTGSLKSNISISIGIPDTILSSGNVLGLITQHVGDTTNLGFMGYYLSGNVYNVNNAPILGIQFANSNGFPCYATLTEIN